MRFLKEEAVNENEFNDKNKENIKIEIIKKLKLSFLNWISKIEEEIKQN